MSKLRWWIFCSALWCYYSTGWDWILKVVAWAPLPEWFGHRPDVLESSVEDAGIVW